MPNEITKTEGRIHLPNLTGVHSSAKSPAEPAMSMISVRFANTRPRHDVKIPDHTKGCQEKDDCQQLMEHCKPHGYK